MVGLSYIELIMGNVVSAVLMYALQAVWFCQRMIDKDYRQNYGSRQECIKPKQMSTVDVFLEKHSSTPKLSKSPHRRSVYTSRTTSLPNYYKTDSRSKMDGSDVNRRSTSLKHRCVSNTTDIYRGFTLEPSDYHYLHTMASSTSSSSTTASEPATNDTEQHLLTSNNDDNVEECKELSDVDLNKNEQVVLEWIKKCSDNMNDNSDINYYTDENFFSITDQEIIREVISRGQPAPYC